MRLQGRGFGTFNTKHSNYTSFSGAVTGDLLEPRCIVVGSCEDADLSRYYLCDGTDDDAEASVIYGTWGMKVNTKATGYKYANNITAVLRSLLPGWAFAQFANEEVGKLGDL